MLKRMRTSCLDWEGEKKGKTGKAGGLQGIEGENDSGYDYSMGLYNENNNGVWKGRGYFF